MKNKILIISGVSGAGKTTVINNLITNHTGNFVIKNTVSATTRPKRPEEVKNRDYYFLNRENFETNINNHQFIEYTQVFGNYYGTPIAELKNKEADFIVSALHLDEQVLKKLAPYAVISILLLPPSYAHLKQRLLQRNANKPLDLLCRLTEAAEYIKNYKIFDLVFVNNKLPIVTQEIIATLNFIYKTVDFNKNDMLNLPHSVHLQEQFLINYINNFQGELAEDREIQIMQNQIQNYTAQQKEQACQEQNNTAVVLP